jgi:antitoxin (DNA-binding transcriptional repressor) of toxin-antitoxin stability system
MIYVDVNEVSRDLLNYIERVEHGETLVIVRQDKAVAELKPVERPARARRPSGLCAGEFVVPDDFDAPLPDEILREFEGA